LNRQGRQRDRHDHSGAGQRPGPARPGRHRQRGPPDLADGDGLPPSLLADLTRQIRCDALSLDGWDTGRQMCWFSQEIPSGEAAIGYEAMDLVFWENYWDCQHYSYPARTGDLRSVVTIADFYWR